MDTTTLSNISPISKYLICDLVSSIIKVDFFLKFYDNN